jgi:hypothetical protein
MDDSATILAEKRDVTAQSDNNKTSRTPRDRGEGSIDTHLSNALTSQQQPLNVELSKEAHHKLMWADKILKARAVRDQDLENQLVKDAAYDLKKHERTVMRMVDAVEARGRAALMRTSRSDKGECRYVSQPWRDLVLALYKHGQRYSRRVNRNQIWALIQASSRKLTKVKDGSSQEIDDCIKQIATMLGVAHQSHTTSINKILKQIKDEVKAGQFMPPGSHRMVYRTHLGSILTR